LKTVQASKFGRNSASRKQDHAAIKLMFNFLKEDRLLIQQGVVKNSSDQ